MKNREKVKWNNNKKKNEQNFSGLWDYNMGSNIHVIRVSDRKRAEKVLEEIMVENLLKLSRDKPTDLRS